MSLLQLAWLGLRRRALSSALTVVYVALGTALALLVVAARESTKRSFLEAARGYDLLLAPPAGSGLQAVLSTLYFVDQPAGTLPWAAYEHWKAEPRTKFAVPYALGDTFRGARVVGTSLEHFDALSDATKRPLREGVAGRLFTPGAFEAVVGSHVASSADVGVGSKITGMAHGIVGALHQHGEVWTVVGILRPTGTPQDRALFVPIDTFYEIEGHEQPGETQPGETQPGDAAHGEHAKRRLSAVGLVLRSPFLRLQVYDELRRNGQGVQGAMPHEEVRKLMDEIVGPVIAAFRALVGVVLLVAGLGILVGLYNTLQGRRREIAVLRALGARPRHVFTVILLEAVLLCVLGGLLGLLLGHLCVALLAPVALEQYGVRLEAALGLADAELLGALALMGVCAGLLPAWRGLRTPVAQNLGLAEG